MMIFDSENLMREKYLTQEEINLLSLIKKPID